MKIYSNIKYDSHEYLLKSHTHKNRPLPSQNTQDILQDAEGGQQSKCC